jgi:hypothetical protein
VKNKERYALISSDDGHVGSVPYLYERFSSVIRVSIFFWMNFLSFSLGIETYSPWKYSGAFELVCIG